MTSTPTRARVTVVTRPLWRIRLARETPRYLLCALSATGLVASARFAIAPPHPAARAPASPSSRPADPAAQGYAVLFARRYLTWNGAEPQASQKALEPFAGPAMELGAGLRLPPGGQERVEWVEVVQEREPAAGEHVYTVAAQTDTAGLLYLSVSVVRAAEGRLALAGYPAFVGAPASAPAQLSARLQEVGDPTLATVVERALRNYLAGSASELAADLASGARVSLPQLALRLESVEHLDWAPGAGSVLASVQAEDGRGVQYTLGYELDVAREGGRWEISAVQMDPDA
jgi:hypothetical protein